MFRSLTKTNGDLGNVCTIIEVLNSYLLSFFDVTVFSQCNRLNVVRPRCFVVWSAYVIWNKPRKVSAHNYEKTYWNVYAVIYPFLENLSLFYQKLFKQICASLILEDYFTSPNTYFESFVVSFLVYCSVLCHLGNIESAFKCFFIKICPNKLDIFFKYLSQNNNSGPYSE
jgi:hypothetical protein